MCTANHPIDLNALKPTTLKKNHQKRHFEKLCAGSQLVCTSALQKVVPTKRHCTQKLEKWKNNLSTTVNCNMLKLIDINDFQ
jgi:hypothetical protein